MSPIYVPGILIFAKEHFSPLVATGGTSIYDTTFDGIRYRVHEFRTTGPSTLTISALGTGLHPKLVGSTANTLEYLVVGGGGGGGGGYQGGGGGAGGVLIGSNPITSTGAYSVVVGIGGKGCIGGFNAGSGIAVNGGDSSISFLPVVAKGGGIGASEAQNSDSTSGGSGGGGGTGSLSNQPAPGFGNKGGVGSNVSQTSFARGGGGGAGGVGQDGANGRAGGLPLSSSISGVGVEYARGGAGAYRSIGGLPGIFNAPSALANTGNGGDGGSGRADGTIVHSNGGDGGSGIVIVRYAI